MGDLTAYRADGGATRALSNLANTAINDALIPATHNSHDIGNTSVRFKDAFFAGELTCWDLTVESGASIKLAGATFENQGHYTSVDTNWIVEHGDQTTAFTGVYALDTSNEAHAALVLSAGGSVLNIIKHISTHVGHSNEGSVVNESGNWAMYVDHSSEMSWNHFTALEKDEYGNIGELTGVQKLMHLDNDHLTLDDVDLEISSNGVKVHISATEDSYINSGQGLGIGTDTLGYDVLLKVAGASELATLSVDNLIVNQPGDIYFYRTNENSFDILQISTPTKWASFKWNGTESAFEFDNSPLHFTDTTPGRWLSFSDGTDNFGFYNSQGTPEASIAANIGSLVTDTTNGQVYVKTTDTVNTGWAELRRVGDEFWSRAGTILSPSTAGDDIKLDGKITLTGGNSDHVIEADGSLLKIGPSGGNLWFSLTTSTWIATEGKFQVGSNGIPSLLRVSGNAAGTDGGEIRLDVPDDYGANIATYRMLILEDDLYIGPDTDTDALKFTGNGAAVTAAFNVDLAVNGTITGADATNWNTAYGWGNHAGLYDPVGTMSTHESTYNHANYDTAYTHSQNNAQAHSDYLVNNADDVTSGTLTAANLISNGTLGIGIASPARAFHMQATNATLRVDRDANSPAIQIHRFPSGNFTTPWKGFILGVEGVGADDGTFFIADFHQSVTGSSSRRLTIDNDGNIGIGTETPGFLLDVDGTLNVASTATLNDLDVVTNIDTDTLNTTGAVTLSTGSTLSIADMTTGSIPFIGAGGLFVQDNGNLFWNNTNKYLGIGKSPSSKLHVAGSENTEHGAAACITIENTSSGGEKWHFRTGATGTQTPVGGISIAGAGAYRLVIDAAGQVGIGATIPGSHLHVSGSGDQIVTLDATDDSQATVNFKSNGTQKGLIGYDDNDDRIVITHKESGTDKADNALIVKEGKVGIGINPTVDFHLEKSIDGTLTSRVYNSNGNGITEHLVGAAGGGHIVLVANSGPGSHYDIPVESVGIAVTYGNLLTISVGDSGSATKMMELNAGTGNVSISANLNVPEVFNSSGDLKIQPDVQGDVALFSDTQVADNENSPYFYLHRKAPEGNDYIRMFINNARRAYFHGSPVGGFYMQGQADMALKSVTEDVILQLGDNAGVKKVRFQDSDGTTLGYVDSLGNAQFDGDMDLDGILNTTSTVLEDAILFSDGSTISHTNLSPFTWHIGNAKYEAVKDMDTQTDGPSGVAFKPDGKKFYVVDNQLDGVFEYDLSTAWDVSTASYNSANFATTGSSAPQGIYFKSDGKKMYLADPGDDEINEYNLLTAWDITSATWSQLYDCSPTEATPVGIHFKPDGRKMYIIGGVSNAVNEYTLTIPWDITTATWDQSYGTSIDAPEDVTFKPDGTKMYIVDGSAEDDIHEFELMVPWDVSTAVLTALYHIWEDSMPNGIAFRPDGTRMYVTGNANNSLYEYHLGLVCHGHMAVGHGGGYGSLPLDVRSEDNNQILVYDTTAHAAGVGSGIMFGADYTDAGDMAVGGRIGVEKVNGTSGNFDFDMIFEIQNTTVGFLFEAMRISTEGYIGIGIAAPEYALDIESSDDNLLNLRSSAAYGLGVGPGLRFCGRVNAGTSEFEGGIIKAIKYDATSGNLGFDLAFYAHQQGVGASIEMLRLSAVDDVSIFSSELRIIATTPKFHIEETDADVNEKVWEWRANAGALSLMTRTDGYAAGYTAFKLERNGTTPDVVSFPSDAQVSIGTDTPETSAALEIKSTDGALIVPRMTTTQRNAMTAVDGMIIYDTTQNAFRKRQNGAWAGF